MPDDPDGPGRTAGAGGPAPIAVFTSVERLHDLVGFQTHVQVPFAAVVEAWPDSSDLLVDPGAAQGGRIAGRLLQRLQHRADEAARTGE